MHQDMLFIEDIYEGLKTDVNAIGGRKVVGSQLWPDKPMDRAAEYLDNCLNRGRAEKLDLEQMLWICREARKKVGKSHAVKFICNDTGHDDPRTIEPADEAGELMRAFIASTEQNTRIMKRLEALTGSGLTDLVRNRK